MATEHYTDCAQHVTALDKARFEQFLTAVFNVAHAAYSVRLSNQEHTTYRGALTRVLDASDVAEGGLPPLTLHGVLMQQGIRMIPGYTELRHLPQFNKYVQAVARMGMNAGIDTSNCTV